MKRIADRLAVLIFCIVMAAVLGGGAVWYYRQIENNIYYSTTANMQELAKHDLNSIKNSVAKNWKQLEAIHERMLSFRYSNVAQMQERLHVEQNSSAIEKLYYVSQDGMLYSGDYMVENDPGMLAGFEGENDRFVVRFDKVNTVMSELQREYLLYGIKIRPWEVDGTVFTGMISLISINSIQEELLIQSYGEQGISSVVDENGYYIVNSDTTLSFQMRQNFYSDYDRTGFRTDGRDIPEIEQALKAGKSFTTLYRDGAGKEKVMTFQKIDQTDWYFIMEVSREVFKNQTNRILYLSVAAVILVVIAVAISFWLWYMMMKKSIQSKTQLEARNEFLSNMSHEIRTPLNGLIGLNHLMIQNLDNREKMQEYLHKASNTAKYLLALVNDILDMSKLQAGKVELHVAPANLDMLLDNVISMQRENIEGRGLQLEIKSDIQAPWIACDEVRVKQVLMNLLSNAAKFTASGGKITMRVCQEMLPESEQGQSVMTYFEVEDTGCGMTEEFQKHIFEVFTQERNHNSESQKGTGLGMSISYLLMKAMDGNLSVKSRLGEGSTFYASFPAAVSQEPDFAKKTHESEQISLDPAKLNILIAEDNELNAEILTEILSEYGITSETAANGRIAVDLFSASKPGTYPVILMDIQMPVMNGYEATKAIRGLKRPDAGSVKILACTANTFQEDIDRVLESGMNDFIGKPIDIDELFRKLAELEMERTRL